jgi:hypothetical protein
MERANAVMDWLGLGDLNPQALYDKMAATLPNGTDCDHILVNACFIRQLPPDVRDHLSDKMEQSTRAIAAAADRFFTSYGTHQNPTAGVANAVEYKSCKIYAVKKIGVPQTPPEPAGRNVQVLGTCQVGQPGVHLQRQGMRHGGPSLAMRPAPKAKNTRAAGNNLDRAFLVDTGAEVLLLPAVVSDKRTSGTGLITPLVAANGSQSRSKAKKHFLSIWAGNALRGSSSSPTLDRQY